MSPIRSSLWVWPDEAECEVCNVGMGACCRKHPVEGEIRRVGTTDIPSKFEPTASTSTGGTTGTQSVESVYSVDSLHKKPNGSMPETSWQRDLRHKKEEEEKKDPNSEWHRHHNHHSHHHWTSKDASLAIEKAEASGLIGTGSSTAKLSNMEQHNTAAEKAAQEGTSLSAKGEVSESQAAAAAQLPGTVGAPEAELRPPEDSLVAESKAEASNQIGLAGRVEVSEGFSAPGGGGGTEEAETRAAEEKGGNDPQPPPEELVQNGAQTGRTEA